MNAGVLIDLLPRTRNYARSASGCAAKVAIDRAFASSSPLERARVFRDFLRNAFINRIIYRFHTVLPRLAAIVANAIPVHVADAIARVMREDGPVVFAGTHFGPVFFQLLLIQRIALRRSLYVLYAERGADRRSCERFMRAIGCHIVLDEPLAARALLDAMHRDPRALIVVAFDHLPNGHRPVPFLDTSIDVQDGVAFLADNGRAPVVTGYWERSGPFVRYTVEGPYGIDATLAPRARRTAFVDGLYRSLEARVRLRPGQWNQWPHMSGAAGAPAHRDERVGIPSD